MDVTRKAREARENSTGWVIQRLTGILDAEMAERLAKLGLDQSQFAVLMTVLENPKLTQAAISKLFRMPAYAISRSLDKLERTGLIARTSHPTSRRANVIEATEAGRDLAPQLFAAIQEVNAKLTRHLGQAEADRLHKTLVRVLNDNSK